MPFPLREPSDLSPNLTPLSDQPSGTAGRSSCDPRFFLGASGSVLTGLRYKGCRWGFKEAPQSLPAKKRSRLPASPAVKAQGATGARRAAGPRAEVHPRSRSRKPGGPSALVTPGLKWAMAGPQGHSGGSVGRRWRGGAQVPRRVRRELSGRGEAAPAACEPPAPPAECGARWLAGAPPAPGSSRCPSPVKPRQQLRAVRERAEQPREPERSERGAVAACGETSFRPGGREEGARPPTSRPASRGETPR